ncbi:MAG: CRTAC1 family protein [Saprospiraceae bacterium]|nr:CRTAC1 family protein [Saprospiraceae bacterium]
MHFSSLVFRLMLLIGLLSCQRQTVVGGISDEAGHARMIAMLDSIAQHADPVVCYNLNGRMADLIYNQMNSLPPEKRLAAQFRYAEQLLFAGKVETSIMQLLDVVAKINDTLRPDTRLVYETLALAYLRLGEVQNCVENPVDASCILPIRQEGVYKFKAGPENAIAIYERILKQYPDDLHTRWLLNIAYMNIGQWPNSVPAAHRIPTQLFQAKGAIAFRNIAGQLGVDDRGLSGGVCTEDFDNDGDIDLFVTSYGLADQCRLYINNGDGTFADRTREANLIGIVSGLNALHCDYDNDGDRDITILRGGWLEGGTHPNSLLRNNGDGTFTDVTIQSGLLSFHPTQAANWADYDGDGWLDLYIANESRSRNPQMQHPNELFRNNGDGTFTNVAPQLGLDLKGFFKGMAWGDVNNDQRPDLFLTVMGGPTRLFINQGGSGQQWKFEDATARAGLGTTLFNFPTWFFDFNNDGFDDILVCGYKIDPQIQAGGAFLAYLLGKNQPGEFIQLYRNNGNNTFTDVSAEYGLRTVTYAMGCNFGDLDNDGWLDFYLGTGTPDLQALVPNRMFRNVEGKRFDEITFNGFAHIQKGHGVAFADLDNDGDEDIYEVMGGAYEGDVANNILFENPGNANHWLALLLEGKTCNRDALQARVAVHVSYPNGQKQTLWRTCSTGGSFGSGSLRMDIGLGANAVVDSVEVYWPKAGEKKEVFASVQANKCFKLRQGSGMAEEINLKKISFAK